MEHNDIGDLADMAEGYDPCDPDSEPNRELCDWMKEPVDQWILDNSPVEADTFRDAREVWANMGKPVIDTSGPEPLDAPEAPDFDPESIRAVTPRAMANFATKLQPMVFEGLELAQISLDVLLGMASDRHMIIGQMFGVPRDDGYVPLLVATLNVGGPSPESCVDQLHDIAHLLEDVFEEEAEDRQVIF